VIGRRLPNEKDHNPQLYRMRLFAKNELIAKSRFWYFLSRLIKIKRANGEIVSVNRILEKHPGQVKNFGVWLRYNSRSGTHNMYKEYRATSRTSAITSCYNEMAGRHRARYESIHIVKIVELKTQDVRRPHMKQFFDSRIKFPLPHRIHRPSFKQFRSTFIAQRPNTFN
jgi:large subunit ribosomal protein L18Ae